ncbi:MAG: hypothetical protein GEV07_28920 [Streptosporangiales bacterium]|nr:hypothetical protein [Streptosporangiales bacterium]
MTISLCWAAYRAGAKLRHATNDAPPLGSWPVSSVAPPRPWGHPDLVLAKAVTTQVLTAEEAEL